MGDSNRIRQILTNLLNNAIKFTRHGQVSVRMEAGRREGGRVMLRTAVKDTGIGIPADRLDRLFKSFSQVDNSTTRKFGGTGLGLVISKRLVELMGGEVTARECGKYRHDIRIHIKRYRGGWASPSLVGQRIAGTGSASFRRSVGRTQGVASACRRRQRDESIRYRGDAQARGMHLRDRGRWFVGGGGGEPKKIRCGPDGLPDAAHGWP